MPLGLWKFLYGFSCLSFAATVMSAHWNVLAAHRLADWNRSLRLLETNHRASLRFGLTSLLLVGIFGNAVGLALGLRFANDSWLTWWNGLWIASLAVSALVQLPAAAALVEEARRAVSGRPTHAFDRALGLWRLGNTTLIVFAISAVGLALFRWRS